MFSSYDLIEITVSCNLTTTYLKYIQLSICYEYFKALKSIVFLKNHIYETVIEKNCSEMQEKGISTKKWSLKVMMGESIRLLFALISIQQWYFRLIKKAGALPHNWHPHPAITKRTIQLFCVIKKIDQSWI